MRMPRGTGAGAAEGEERGAAGLCGAGGELPGLGMVPFPFRGCGSNSARRGPG